MLCPSCDHDNATGRDFCARCGAYVRWELSGVLPAAEPRSNLPSDASANGAPPASAAVAVSEPTLGGRVGLTLRPAVDPEPSEGPVTLQVAPGSTGVLVAEIDNRTPLVDHFHIRVSGLPADWCSVTPATLHLNPYGARGEHRAAAQIRLAPPRSPDAEARAWPFTVEVLSEDRQAQVASATATLVIEPYADLVVETRPERRAGRRRARFDVLVRNRANAAVEVDVAVSDDEEACRIEVEPRRVTAHAGEERRARCTAHVPKPIWFGRPVDRSLQVAARPRGQELEPAPRRVVFRQRPWLPWWVPMVAVLVIALLLLVLKLLPRTTEVPDLRGARSPFVAQQRLTEAGLELAPNPQRRVTRGAAPGTVVDQDPAPGDEIEKGSAVTVVQAVGSRVRTVPSVVGLSPQDADRTLRELGLVLGTVQPQPAELDAKIAVQLPDAGVRAKQGTAVNVSLAPGAKPGKSVPESKEKPQGAAAATGAGGAPSGLAPSAARNSRLAFDDGQNVSVWDPAAGQVTPLTTTGTAARPVVEPAWSADGAQLAYMHVGGGGRGRIFVADLNAGESSARPVDGGEGDHHRPSISPSGELLAYISEDSTSGGRVCLQPHDGRTHPPSCLRPGDWRFHGRPAWSPDGNSMLVMATARGNAALSGLFQYVTQVPGSARARDWHAPGADLVLPIAHPNSVAWSPDGKQVAVMASPDGTRFHLFLVSAQPAGLTGTQRPVADVSGCEAAWRPDGKLAVSVYDCSQPVAAAGQVVLLDPARPSSFTQLSGVHGRNPAWQPLPLP
jgi:hypothetical protein